MHRPHLYSVQHHGAMHQMEQQIDLNFIDTEKAFDRVHRERLWKILSAYVCSEKFIRIFKAFYNNFACSVIDDNKLATGSASQVEYDKELSCHHSYSLW